MVSVSSMPWMTENEVRLFARWIPLGCIALEFGSGGSTRFFFENGGGESRLGGGRCRLGAVIIGGRLPEFFHQKTTVENIPARDRASKAECMQSTRW